MQLKDNLNISVMNEIEKNGFVIIENALEIELINRLKTGLVNAIDLEKKYHKTKDHRDFGMVMFCPVYSDSFIDLITSENYLAIPEAILGKHCIVYSYTSSSMPPNSGNYSTRIHHDCLHFMADDYITRIQALVALDDFTLENGATYVLPNSHRMNEAPSEETFYKNAIRLTMKAGSVRYAHAKLWHAGGLNVTNQWRHAVTTVFCKAYMKQRVDIPRLMVDKETSMPERAKQKLGFYAQVPASYDEYYAPPEKRKFTQPLE